MGNPGSATGMYTGFLPLHLADQILSLLTLEMKKNKNNIDSFLALMAIIVMTWEMNGNFLTNVQKCLSVSVPRFGKHALWLDGMTKYSIANGNSLIIRCRVSGIVCCHLQTHYVISSSNPGVPRGSHQDLCTTTNGITSRPPGETRGPWARGSSLSRDFTSSTTGCLTSGMYLILSCIVVWLLL